MAEPAARHWPALALVRRAATALPADFDDLLAVALDEVAATSVDDNGAGQWRAFFGGDESRDRALPALRSTLGAFVEVTPIDVPDEGWVVKVQAGLGPVRIGRLVVTPPWHAASGAFETAATPDTEVITIEPSTGFGTGHHQSTRLCLIALQRLPLGGARVIDVGTGSGVLAIAAVTLGAREVVAFDDDPDAVAAAARNIASNGLDGRLALTTASVSELAAQPGDVVMANLTALLLHRHARAISDLVRPGGRLVASGFTTDQVRVVEDAFPEYTVERRDEEDDWVGLTLGRH